jgi:dTDP-4-amino-4,6-dideoxygalactose transaminase
MGFFYPLEIGSAIYIVLVSLQRISALGPKVMTGQGGVITTDHREWTAELRSIRNQGRNEISEATS